mgnify:CR=1 FL=1
MKSIYFLCEYGISVSTVINLDDSNISLNDILLNNNKIDNILKKGSKKRQQIIVAAKNVVMDQKTNSLYELIKFDVSVGTINKLFSLKINILDINKENLQKHKITGAMCNRIICSQRKWAKSVGYKIQISKSDLENVIKNELGHKRFSAELLKKIIEKKGYDCSELNEMLKEIKLIKEENEYYYPFEIYDLINYGLSNTNLKFLIKNNIGLEDINMDMKKKYNIPQYKFEQIIQAYNIFLKNNSYTSPLNKEKLNRILIKEFKFNNYVIDDVYKILQNEDKNNINKCIYELLQNGKILKIGNEYLNVFQKLDAKIKEIEDKNGHRDIVIKKLSGMTLEHIGHEYGITKERVRQIFSKEFSKIKDISEDKYASIFQKYNFDRELFCNCFKEPELTYNYLKEKYKRGEMEAYEILKNNEIIPEQLDVIRKKYNLIIYNDENIVATKQSILIAILKGNGNQLSFDQIRKIYNEVVNANNLSLDKITIDDYRNIDAILNRSSLVLNTLGSSYRYYDYNEIDEYDYKELKTLFNIEPGVYSSELFFKDNPILMKKIDIRDEYELHNLFRKILNNFDDRIIFGRMPDIYIECDSKLSFINEKIHELSPITLDEFVEYIYQNYGHKINTMKSYILTNFNSYISVIDNINYLNTEYPLFTNEQYEFMKKYLKEDIYSNVTIKELMTREFGVNDFELLNNQNFNKLGYKVRGNYIIKNSICNLENYFREKVLNQDYYIVPNEVKRIGSTYTNYLYKLIYDKALFKIDEDKYITISKLNKIGISRSDIDDFVNKIEKLIPENEYFNLYTLNLNFKSKLFDYDFPNCFYENIIMIIDNVKITKVKNNILFIKGINSTSKEKFINSFVTKNKIYISEIKKNINEKYNIDLTESYIKDYINVNKYYLHSGTNCIYLSKNEYENEINQWDILKYID